MPRLGKSRADFSAGQYSVLIGVDDGAVTITGPAGADAQPAAGFLAGLAFAIPEKLDFYPAIFVAVDFLAGKPVTTAVWLPNTLGLALAELALFDTMDQTVDAITAGAEGEKGALVQ